MASSSASSADPSGQPSSSSARRTSMGVHVVGLGNKFALGHLLPGALAPDDAELLLGLHSGNVLPINVAHRWSPPDWSSSPMNNGGQYCKCQSRATKSMVVNQIEAHLSGKLARPHLPPRPLVARLVGDAEIGGKGHAQRVRRTDRPGRAPGRFISAFRTRSSRLRGRRGIVQNKTGRLLATSVPHHFPHP
jgi:hypothetical protein